MSILCTVRIPHTLERVQSAEAAHPELMEVITGAAMKYMTGHKRIANDTEVIDLDEFNAKDDYDKFFEEAGEAIAKWNEALGGEPAKDTIYEVIPEA